MTLRDSRNAVRGLALVAVMSLDGIAYGQATQSGSPPQMDPGVDASGATDESRTASVTKGRETALPEKPLADAGEQQEDSSRARYKKFSDGEGAPK